MFPPSLSHMSHKCPVRSGSRKAGGHRCDRASCPVCPKSVSCASDDVMSPLQRTNPAKHSALNKVSQIAHGGFVGNTRKLLIVGIGNSSLCLYEGNGLFLAL